MLMLCLERLTRIDDRSDRNGSESGSGRRNGIGTVNRKSAAERFGAVVVFFVGALERSCGIC